MTTRSADAQSASDVDRPMWRYVLARCGILVPSVLPFGMAVGVLAYGKGFSLIEAVIMSVMVFAGASQVAALEAWTSPPALLALAAIVAAVNSRYFLTGATLGPILSGRGKMRGFFTLALAVDANWAIAMQMRASPDERSGFIRASGLFLMVLWVISTAVGHRLGTVVTDTHAFGVDLLVISFFSALLATMWRGGPQIASWTTALAVALGVWWAVDGYWYIVAGAISGAFVAAFLGDDDQEASDAG